MLIYQIIIGNSFQNSFSRILLILQMLFITRDLSYINDGSKLSKLYFADYVFLSDFPVDFFLQKPAVIQVCLYFVF